MCEDGECVGVGGGGDDGGIVLPFSSQLYQDTSGYL